MKTVFTSFAQLDIYDNYVIARISEGIHVDDRYIPEIVKALDQHFNTPFGWISDKVYSYSVDPFIAPKIVEQVPWFSSWCNVVYGSIYADNAQLAKAVLPKNFPVNAFNTLEPAIVWTDKVTTTQSQACM